MSGLHEIYGPVPGRQFRSETTAEVDLVRKIWTSLITNDWTKQSTLNMISDAIEFPTILRKTSFLTVLK